MRIILFGVSGHLSTNKLLPALLNLKGDSDIPQFEIIGFARSNKELEGLDAFIEGDYSKLEDVERLKDVIQEDERIFFYFAVPQKVYIPLLDNLFKAKLIGKGIYPNRRILLEKPFGANPKDAEKLQAFLEERFEHSQILRVDHYAGKENLRNAKKHDPSSIKKVEINIHEKDAVGNRGGFYDELGALYDVGQNHLLYSLSTTLQGYNGDRNEIIKNLRYIAEGSRFGQYEGYKDEKNIPSNSSTETHFHIKGMVDHPDWKHVDVHLSSGKGLGKKESSIHITHHDDTKKVIDLGGGRDAYENLFKDLFLGREDIFVSMDEIRSAWNFIEDAKEDKKKKSLIKYKKGSLPHDIQFGIN